MTSAPEPEPVVVPEPPVVAEPPTPPVESPPPAAIALEPRSLAVGAALGIGLALVGFAALRDRRAAPAAAEPELRRPVPLPSIEPRALAVEAPAEQAAEATTPEAAPAAFVPDAGGDPELAEDLVRMHRRLDARLAEVAERLDAIAARQDELDRHEGTQTHEITAQRAAIARLQRALRPPLRPRKIEKDTGQPRVPPHSCVKSPGLQPKERCRERMRKRLVIAGTSREGLELLPLLEANPAVEVCALLAADPAAALAELRQVDPSSAARLERRVTADVSEVLRIPGLVAIVDASAPESMRERLGTLRGVHVLPPALARMLYAFGPADAMSKPDLLQALREILDSYDLTQDRRQLLRLVLQIAVTATGADRGSLMLWDPRERALRVEVALGIEEEVIPKIRVQPGEGIAGRAFAAERSILLHGKADRRRFEIVRERDDVESAISAPLVHDGRVIGVLNLSHARNQPQFGSEDQIFVDELARLDARIIARAEEYHGLLRESQTLRAETEVRRRLARGEPLVRRLTAVCASLAGQLRGGVCQLYLREADSDTLVLQAASTPIDPLAVRERLRFGEGLPGRAAALGRAVLLGGGDADAGLCYAVLPLQAADHLVGVLAVQGERGAGDADFDVERLRAGAAALADELAGVLRSARLERDARRTAQLAEVVAALGACTDEREIAERVTGFAVSLLEAQDAVLRLREEPSGRYRIAAWSGVGEWRKAALAELERKLATDALQTRHLVRVADLAADPAWRDHAVGVGTAMIAPLVRDGRGVGCLSVLGKVPEDPLLGERFGASDEELLERLAQHALVALAGLARGERNDADPVTGLPAQRALRERLDAELARSRARGHALALVALRIDGLDALREPAHADAAERIALAVSQSLRAALRDFDVVARPEPSLFTVLVPEPDTETPALLAALYRAARGALDAQGDAARGLEPRLGYAVYPADATDADALERIARERRVEAL